MIKLQNNILTRTPLPAFLVGLDAASLADLSWTDPALGVSDCKWLPEVDDSPALSLHERYGAETLTLVGDAVSVVRAIAPWSQTEIDAELAALRTAAIKKIDVDADKIYGDVLGNRAEEYALAEQDATAYKAAGYSGAVPSSVQSWATAKSWTATQAADDILTTAAAWRGAQAAIRAARLLRKEQVRTTADAAGVDAAMAAWQAFVSYIRGQLAI